MFLIVETFTDPGVVEICIERFSTETQVKQFLADFLLHQESTQHLFRPLASLTELISIVQNVYKPGYRLTGVYYCLGEQLDSFRLM